MMGWKNLFKPRDQAAQSTPLATDAEAAKSLDQISAELGPFPDVTHYEFEPEFQRTRPRPIAKDLRRGAYEQRWRAMLVAFLVVGLGCLTAPHTPWLHDLSYYILPLGYLDWGGWICIAGVLASAAWHFLLPGRYRYITHGTPIVVRILHSFPCVRTVGEARYYHMAIFAEYLDPKTQELRRIEFHSDSLGNAAFKRNWTTTLQPGDLATAVYLDDRPDKAKLYAFLLLNPRLNILRKNGRPHDPRITLGQVFIPLILLFVLLWLIVCALYASRTYSPRDVDWKISFGIIGGAAVLIPIFLWLGRHERKRNQPGLSPFMCTFAGLALGAMVGGAAMLFLNTKLDRSLPQYREFETVNFWQKTFNYIIRNYSIEYRELVSGKNERYPAHVEEMHRYETTRCGMLVMRDGFFGWPWIETIHPLEVEESKTAPPAAPNVQLVHYEDGLGRSTPIYLTLRFKSPARSLPAPSPTLCQKAWSHVISGDDAT